MCSNKNCRENRKKRGTEREGMLVQWCWFWRKKKWERNRGRREKQKKWERNRGESELDRISRACGKFKAPWLDFSPFNFRSPFIPSLPSLSLLFPLSLSLSYSLSLLLSLSFTLSLSLTLSLLLSLSLSYSLLLFSPSLLYWETEAKVTSVHSVFRFLKRTEKKKEVTFSSSLPDVNCTFSEESQFFRTSSSRNWVEFTAVSK